VIIPLMIMATCILMFLIGESFNRGYVVMKFEQKVEYGLIVTLAIIIAMAVVSFTYEPEIEFVKNQERMLMMYNYDKENK
jgi:hypothetical protein